MQNKLLKLLLKYDRRTSTNCLHHEMSILQLNDMHTVKVLSFVNECRSCRIPAIFFDYYKVRETRRELRNNRTLDIPWARTDLGQSRCDIEGARFWNMNFDTVKSLLHKKSFRKRITKYVVSKYIWLIRLHCVFSFIIYNFHSHWEYIYWTNVYLYHLQNVYFILAFPHEMFSPQCQFFAWIKRCCVPSVQSVARPLLL